MKDITTALQNIQEQGSFCAKRMAPIDKLNLEVKEFGALKFPLNSRHTKALIKLAKPAQFGWRDQTLLDKKVRNAWEISKNNIKIDTIAWNKVLKPTLELLRSDLGLPENAELKASLHNLLIYEPGQFFDYHQDSEKLDGMVATLVVVLPSPHSGGTLIVDNQGVKKQFNSSRFSLDELTFVAFYADCHHVVKEVKEGYRMALTYNLTLENHPQKVNVPNEKKSFEKVVESLHHYFSNADDASETSYRIKSPRQCIYLLDHSYTQKGLSWNHLKNGDNLRAEALKAAAEALDLEIHMALADIQETWDCEVDYDSGYRHYYYEDDEEEEEDGFDEDNMELRELIDSSTTLRHWIDQKNKPINYPDYSVSGRYLCWTKASKEFEPFESEYEGFMGNYGNTMDRWYHRAAIILWQKKDHYPVLFQMDVDRVVDELLKLSKKESHREQVQKIIDSLLPYWSSCLERKRDEPFISIVFKLALYVKDPQLAQAMVAGFSATALTPERTKLFLSLQDVYGTHWCLNILQEWTKIKNRWSNALKFEKISDIVKNLAESQNDYKELTDWLLAYQLSKIKETNESCQKNNTRATLIKATPERMKEAMDFVAACVTVNNHLVYLDFLEHMISRAGLYPAIEWVNVLDFLAERLNKRGLEQWYYQKLFDHTYGEVKKEKDLGLRKGNDWSIKEKLSCKCKDCATLGEFLQSSTLQDMRWPLSKERRKHIHQVIDGLGIPVTHETKHSGSPHKLILAKTRKLHSQAKQRFGSLEHALSRLAKARLAIEKRINS